MNYNRVYSLEAKSKKSNISTTLFVESVYLIFLIKTQKNFYVNILDPVNFLPTRIKIPRL